MHVQAVVQRINSRQNHYTLQFCEIKISANQNIKEKQFAHAYTQTHIVPTLHHCANWLLINLCRGLCCQLKGMQRKKNYTEKNQDSTLVPKYFKLFMCKIKWKIRTLSILYLMSSFVSNGLTDGTQDDVLYKASLTIQLCISLDFHQRSSSQITRSTISPITF